MPGPEASAQLPTTLPTLSPEASHHGSQLSRSPERWPSRPATKFPPPRQPSAAKRQSQAGQGLPRPPHPPQAATSAFPPAAPVAGLGAHPADWSLKTLRCVDPSGRPSRVCWPQGCTHPVGSLRAEPQHNCSDCVIFVSKVGGVFSRSEQRVCDRRLDEGFPAPSPPPAPRLSVPLGQGLCLPTSDHLAAPCAQAAGDLRPEGQASWMSYVNPNLLEEKLIWIALDACASTLICSQCVNFRWSKMAK